MGVLDRGHLGDEHGRATVGRYRKIEVRIWNDEKFRVLTDQGKLTFLFLLSHPHMTSLGAMRATIPGLAAELGWPSERLSEAFGEAFAKGMAKHDESACFIYLPNFLKHNPPESPNVVKSWREQFDLLPECSLKTQLLQDVKAFVESLREGFREAFGEAFAKGMPNPKPKPKPEPNIKYPPTPKGGMVGVSKKSGSGVGVNTLRDTGALAQWLAEQTSIALANTPDVLLHVVAAAERAIEVGTRNKVGLFITLCREGAAGDWGKLSGEQLDNAKRRLREWNSSGHSAAAVSLANAIGAQG